MHPRASDLGLPVMVRKTANVGISTVRSLVVAREANGTPSLPADEQAKRRRELWH